MITSAAAVAIAAAELGRDPRDRAARDMLSLTTAVLDNLAGLTRYLTYCDERLEALVAERVAEELAARGCARCGRLRAVPR
jgi:hypothetical protein